MRLRLFWLGGLLVALLAPAIGFPQGPPQRGGFQTDPTERFNQYSGGKDVWDRSKITDPDGQRRFDFVAQRLGVTNGVITRQQYLDYSKERESRGGPFGRMTPPGGAPLMPTGAGGAATPLQPPTAPPAGESRGRFGRGGPELSAPTWAESGFRRADRNGDGVLDNDEIPDTLRNERDRWDSNRNGFIDLTEFKAFTEGRMQQWQAERGSPSSGPSFGGSSRSSRDGNGGNPAEAIMSALMNRMADGGLDRGSSRDSNRDSSRDFDRDSRRSFDPWRDGPAGMPFGRQQPEENSRPVVYSPSSLPRELPSWFTQRDTDKDGQIGLYEWRTSGEALSQFERLDANNDGYVTAEEVLRDQAVAARQGSSEPAGASGLRNLGSGSSAGSPFARGPFGSGGPGFPGGPGFSGMQNVPFDRERLMEMMSRGREGMGRGGNGPTPGWMGSRGGNNGPGTSSGDRGESSGRRSFGPGGGTGSGEFRGFPGKGGPGKGRRPGGE